LKKILLLTCFIGTHLLGNSDINELNFLDHLGSIEFFSASFVQKTISSKTERTVEGTIKASRKGKFKLSYEEPLNEVLFSDGINLHRFDPDLEQLDIQPIENILKETPIGLFSSEIKELKKSFKVERCLTVNKKTKCNLSVVSNESFLDSIEFVLTNGLIDSIRYKDSFDQVVLLTLSNTSYKNIPDNAFHFIIPPGIDVVQY